MKTKFTLLFIGLILTVSCSDILSDYELSEYDCQKQAVEIIELGYLSFVDQQYQLDLDLIDAIALGYSSKAYEMLVAKIDEFNEIITQELNRWRIDKNITEVRISDATYSKFKDEPFNYETKEVSINGVIEAYDNSPHEETYMLPPVEASSIIANCFARNYPFGGSTVTTIQGSIVDIQSVMFQQEMEVRINYTNSALTVRYQTTCSGGGICSWKLNIKDAQIYN